MIGTTEFEYCKEKAMGIIADWLWVLAIIIGEITGVIQREDIGINKGWKHWWKNNNIKLHSSLGENGEDLEKLKYMKDFREKSSIYSYTGIEDYQALESYTPIGVYSEQQWFVQLELSS